MPIISLHITPHDTPPHAVLVLVVNQRSHLHTLPLCLFTIPPLQVVQDRINIVLDLTNRMNGLLLIIKMSPKLNSVTVHCVEYLMLMLDSITLLDLVISFGVTDYYLPHFSDYMRKKYLC